MIREAMQYIEELVTNAAKKDEIKIGNDTYTEKNLRLIRPQVNKCETLSVNNLSMLIANVKNELGDQHNLPLLLNVEEQSVYVYTSYDVNKDRQKPFMAFAQSPDIRFNQYISVEAMIIQLQTCFVQDDAGNKDQQVIKRYIDGNRRRRNNANSSCQRRCEFKRFCDITTAYQLNSNQNVLRGFATT